MVPPDLVAAPASARERLAARFVFFALLALCAFCYRAGWHNRLLDTHPFRQTQTALSTYWMKREGVRLDYSTPVMGAPWALPMEFPIYEAAVVGTMRLTGLPLESAGRTVSVGCFILTLPALFLLLRRLGLPDTQNWLFLTLVVTCPVYIFYTRTFLIESTALFFSGWFLLLFQMSLSRGRPWVLTGAAGAGIAAGLAKVTTFAVFLVPAALLLLFALRASVVRRAQLLLRATVAALPGFLAATWWVFYSDAIKRQNDLAVMMTSENQSDWNYGPLALRFQTAFWRQLGIQVERAVLPAGSLLVAGVLALLFLRGRMRIALALLVAALAGPLVFANLYQVHDYYFFSSGIFLLALVALPLKAMFERASISGVGRWGAVLAVIALQLHGYFSTYYAAQAAPVPNPPEIIRGLQHVTAPDDVIMGLGVNWNSVFPYYAERRGLMVPDRYLGDERRILAAIAALKGKRIAALIFPHDPAQVPVPLKTWLARLEMDETPLFQTGDNTVYLRRDMLPEALQSLAAFPLKDIYLYQGKVGAAGETPRLVYWADLVADQTAFSMMHPRPLKVLAPYGAAATDLEGRRIFLAHPSTDIEIPLPAGARHVQAEFGLSPGSYERTDGVEFQVVHLPIGGGEQILYQRFLRPGTIVSDRGFQSADFEMVAPLEGSLVFRTLPGGNPNFDWAYWAKIDIR